ncbi:nucleoside kinase [Murdochiella sp. Marseille-P8839]|nr:nucleoside kinase [Murdochiella sp. Marseille-P8839]
MRKCTMRLYSKKEGEEITVSTETTFAQCAEKMEEKALGRIVLARVENHLFELTQPIPEEAEEIVLMDTTDTDGYRVYMRTLSFVFLEAIDRLFPDTHTVIEHSISGGLYCVLHQNGHVLMLDTRQRDELKVEMRKIIEADIPIVRENMTYEEAKQLFRTLGRADKVDLYAQQKGKRVAVYRMGNAVDSFFGYMAPSSGYVSVFDLELFDHGLVLLGVDRHDKRRVNNFIPTYLLSDTYNEAEDWADRQGIYTVAQLNRSIQNGTIGDVCRMNEALLDHKIMHIAEDIVLKNKRIVLIAAPSSSGKTSFAYKLMTSLRVLGKRPVAISLDDYFVDRENTPLDENGEPDFEALEAIDLRTFNADMRALLTGEEIERIRFDFVAGKRVHTNERIRLGAEEPVLLEGIHGLNPKLSAEVDNRYKYRIALSVITQINLDAHNRIPTTDLRLMRRMARDLQFRGRDVRETIRTWPDVRRGEDRNIFPYSELADVMFNSSFVYEIATLKPILEQHLRGIGEEEPERIEAVRILSLLQYFLPLTDTSDVVNTSILREFIGGSKLV